MSRLKKIIAKLKAGQQVAGGLGAIASISPCIQRKMRPWTSNPAAHLVVAISMRGSSLSVPVDNMAGSQMYM